jgi:flagellar hook protein FlgE
MSLLSALYSGVSGLGANGTAIAVIGDNIANVNTVGFKGSRILFQDVLSQSVMGGQLGRGTSTQIIDKMMSQGNLQATGSSTDLAINGNGFFVLRDRGGAQLYTRAGQFRLDADGNLVNPAGLFVLGYPERQAGVASSVGLQGINLASVQSPPQLTRTATLTANLDSNAQVAPGGPAFDPANPAATSNFSSGMTIYDSLGQAHTVSVYFRKAAPGQWEWYAIAPPGELSSVPASGYSASGTLTFDTGGALQAESITSNSFNFTGAAPNQTVAFDFGQSIAEGGTGLTGTTQFARASEMTFQSQDGYAAGTLQGVNIDGDGVVTGSFSNGTTRALARVALASFQAQAGLEKAGGGLYRETLASGAALIGRAGEGGRGTISSSSLELSNVDLAQEFVNLITAQRAYQASSKTITTADSLLGEVLNLKRM